MQKVRAFGRLRVRVGRLTGLLFKPRVKIPRSGELPERGVLNIKYLSGGNV